MSTTLYFEILKALGETCYVVFFSSLFAILLGLGLALLLVVTKPKGLFPHPYLYQGLSLVINLGRSIPFIILMIALIPLTRFIIGSSIGTTAAIVPLTLAALPFFARMAEAVFSAINPDIVESGKAMGASPTQIIRFILLPEALPGLINAITITIINLISYSAMAGAMGGGGLGDLGIRYGYQRFNPTVMLITIVFLILLVQGIQHTGDWIERKISHSSFKC